MNGTLQQHNTIQETPLWPVANQYFGGLARNQETYNNWDFLLTTDPDGGNVSSSWPPFEHSELSVGIYEHVSMQGLFNVYFDSSYYSRSFGEDLQDIPSILKNVTDSVTGAIMRSNGGESVALGIVWRQEPSYKIEWGWLAFPLVLVFSSAILLVLMIVASRNYDAPH